MLKKQDKNYYRIGCVKAMEKQNFSKKYKIYAFLISCIMLSHICFSVNVFAEQTFEAYGCFPQLNFESENGLSKSTWGGDVEVKFVNNDSKLTAYEGTGAMYVNSQDGQFSVWGGPTSGEGNQPKEGDTISGYFYYKRLREGGDWKLPRVRVYSEKAGNNENGWLAVTKDIDSTNNNIAPIGEWVKIEIESTGKTMPKDDTLAFNITCDGTGNEFMIDNVVFGTMTGQTEEPEQPGQPNISTTVPVISEYAGSTLNGDFEIGNASVGNQYWGSWPDGALGFVTNPSTTEPGKAQSGNNMVKIINNGNSWNIFDFSSSDTDFLPRLNDVVAGSYWLYVPSNADLTKNIPYVNVGYQSTSNGDVMISTGEGFDKSRLVKGAWNEIPILPMSGGKMAETNKQATIFIIAQNVDTAAGYYIDNIKIGKVQDGFFLTDSSTIVDDNGMPTTIDNDDVSVNARVVVQNTVKNTNTAAEAIAAVYEDGVFKSIKLKKAEIMASGDSGMSLSEIIIDDINIQGIDKSKMKIKVFLLDSINNMVPLTASRNVFANTKHISPEDENIKYIGRWIGDENSYKSTYIRPYLKTSFTGTSLKIDMAESSNLLVTIDGEQKAYNGVGGLVTLADNLKNGVHSLRISTMSLNDSIKYNGFYIDSDAEMREPKLANTHIEFIGDSITAWDNGYAWQVGEKMNVEHSRIAWPGIALVDGNGYTGFSPLLGIASGYFKAGLPGAQGITADVEDWDFAKADYVPDIIVINIGTNDCEAVWSIPSVLDNFTNTYSQFIDKLRAQFPVAEIFVMRAVSMPHQNVNDAVYNMITPKIAADSKLHYIDTTDWGVTISSDNIHPDANGHTIITNKLIDILTPYLK